jgi:hypothetical protein
MVFWYLLGLCATGLLFEDMKKVEFTVGRTLVKVVFFLKNDVIFENSAILNIRKKFKRKG